MPAAVFVCISAIAAFIGCYHTYNMPRAPIFEWEGDDYAFEEKGSDWYWALGIISVAAIIAAILFGNFLLAVVILTGAGALALQAAKRGTHHHFALVDDGLMIDDRLYPYDTMLHFSILEYLDAELPPALSIKTRSLLAPHLLVPLSGVDPDELYEYLLLHMDEGHHETSVVDRLVEMFEL